MTAQALHKPFTIRTGTLHLLFSLILLPGYYLLGAEFKLLLIPYVAWLVLSARGIFFPALLVHFMAGTLVSQIILIACGAKSLSELKQLRKHRLHIPLLVAIIPLPALIYAALQGSRTMTEVGVYLDLYLGIFAFFYGVLITKDINDRVLKQVLLVLALSVLIQLTGLVGGTVRYYFFALPALITFLLGGLVPGAKWQTSLLIASMAIILAIISMISQFQVTFILSFSVIVSIALALSRLHWRRIWRGVPVGKSLVAIMILTTGYLALYSASLIPTRTHVEGISDVEKLTDVPAAITYKLLADRAPIWQGAWATITSQNAILPPQQPLDLAYFMSSGAFREVEFGAHNVGLELLRSYGWLAGGIALGLYFLIIGASVKGLSATSSDDTLIPILSSVIALLVIGGTFGHFVLNNNFSFLLFSLAGIGYGSIRTKSIRGTTPRADTVSIADSC